MSHRILLVDDEDDILEFVRYNLQREGYEVFTARDGAEGVARALEVHPHLILLDRMMPRMDGLETCRRLREHDELKDTMIVFLTALGEDEHQLTGFAAGADDYISKPIKMHILVSRLKAILKRIGAGDAAPRDTGGVTIDPARYIVKRNGEEISLPRKEFALLTLLMSDPGRLFSRGDLLPRMGRGRSGRRPHDRRPHSQTAAEDRRRTHHHRQGRRLQVREITQTMAAQSTHRSALRKIGMKNGRRMHRRKRGILPEESIGKFFLSQFFLCF